MTQPPPEPPASDGDPSTPPPPPAWGQGQPASAPQQPSAPGWQQPPGQPGGGAQPGYGQQPAYGQQPGYGVPPAGYVDPQAKSKLAAGLLGIFLGGFGVHRFYLGYTKIGVIQILVTVFTCGLGSIWGLIEGIMYLVGAGGYTTDADGRPLKD